MPMRTTTFTLADGSPVVWSTAVVSGAATADVYATVSEDGHSATKLWARAGQPVDAARLRAAQYDELPTAVRSNTGTLASSADVVNAVGRALRYLPSGAAATTIRGVKNLGNDLVTIAPQGTDTIDGGTDAVDLEPGQVAKYQSDGAGGWTNASGIGTYASPQGAWSAGTYSINQVVTYNGSTYRSKVNANTATPGTDASKWEAWGGSSVAVVQGLNRVKASAAPVGKRDLRATPQIKWATVRPKITATNSPLPSSNNTDTQFVTDGSGPFNVWGSLAYQSTGSPPTWASLDQGTTLTTPPWSFEFCTDSPLFALYLTAAGTQWEVWVNDELVANGTPPSGGSWIQFNWNSNRTMRRYTIHGGTGLGVRTLRTAVSDTVFAPTDTPRVKCAWIGDSYSQLTGVDGLSRMPRLVCGQFGWRPYVSAQGGTGFDAAPGGTQDFVTRTAYAITAAPDALIYAFHNVTASASTAAAATTALTSVRASLPNAPVFVVGPIEQSTAADASQAATRTAVAAAVAAIPNCIYINTAGWFVGTGYVTNVKNDGNADVLISSDGTHPTSFGMEYMSSRIIDAIGAYL